MRRNTLGKIGMVACALLVSGAVMLGMTELAIFAATTMGTAFSRNEELVLLWGSRLAWGLLVLKSLYMLRHWAKTGTV